MAISIDEKAYQALLTQALQDAPIESCGYLLGPDGNTVTEHYPMTNTDHSEEHFSFDPKEQFAAIRYARSKGLKVVGNWHSHPASPSRPSEEDLRLALDPNILYFILSLQEENPVFNAFRITDGKIIEKYNIK